MGFPTVTAAVKAMSIQTMDVIYVNIWSILISLLNLVLLFLIFKKFLFKPVKAIIAKRKGEVERLYTDAEAAKESAEQDRQLYAEKLADAHTEADTILHHATEKANRRADEILTEATQNVAAMKQTAEAEIEQERKKALNEVKGEISSISLQIAEKMVGRGITDADQDKLLDEFLADLGGEQGGSQKA